MAYLITGATVYIGRRLFYRLHESTDRQLRVLARNPEACPVPGANIQVFRGAAFSPATLRETMKGVEVAWHLWVPVDTMQKKTAKAPAILPRWPAVSKGQSEHLISREETGRVGFYSATHIRGRYWLLQYDIRKNDSLNRNSIGS